MRRAAKIDANQNQVVDALRRLGYSVLHLHTIGKGCPDILVGKSGKNYLFEIKDPEKPRSSRKLTEDEEEFRSKWRGQVHTIHTWEEAMRIMTNK